LLPFIRDSFDKINIFEDKEGRMRKEVKIRTRKKERSGDVKNIFVLIRTNIKRQIRVNLIK